MEIKGYILKIPMFSFPPSRIFQELSPYWRKKRKNECSW